MDNTMMMYIVVGLLAIFFIVLLIFSAKTWRVLHLITIFLVFLAAAFFVWLSAATLKTQAEWRTPANKLEAKNEAADKQIELLKHGVEGEEDLQESVRDYQAALTRVLLDRPLAWRRATPQVRDPAVQEVILTIPPQTGPPPPAAGGGGEDPAPDDEDAGEPAPPPAGGTHTLEDNAIVFAFLEGESPLSGALARPADPSKGPYMIPRMYLGEFKVIGHTDNTVTLRPAVALTAIQQDSLLNSTWTIYNEMPTDSSQAFAGINEDDLKKLMPHGDLMLSTDEYDAEIGDLYRFFAGLDASQFPAGMVPASVNAMKNMVRIDEVQMTDAAYEELIRSIGHDGEKFVDATDPQDRKWTRIKFNHPTMIQVDAVLREVAQPAAPTPPPEAEIDYQIDDVVAMQRATDEVIIADTNLISTNITGEAGIKNLGQFQLGISVNDPLKLKSDWEIAELWDKDPTSWNPLDKNDPPPVLRPLDQLGANELDSVREAKSLEFDEDDEAIVDPATADFLIEKGIATEVESIFVRQLHDYKNFFRDDTRREELFQHNALVILQDTVTLVQAAARAAEQGTFRDDEIAKLKLDAQGFGNELTAIENVLNKMEAYQKALNARLSVLYTNNVKLAARIRKLQFDQQEAILRGGGEAPPPAPTTTEAPTTAVSAP